MFNIKSIDPLKALFLLFILTAIGTFVAINIYSTKPSQLSQSRVKELQEAQDTKAASSPTPAPTATPPTVTPTPTPAVKSMFGNSFTGQSAPEPSAILNASQSAQLKDISVSSDIVSIILNRKADYNAYHGRIMKSAFQINTNKDITWKLEYNSNIVSFSPDTYLAEKTAAKTEIEAEIAPAQANGTYTGNIKLMYGKDANNLQAGPIIKYAIILTD